MRPSVSVEESLIALGHNIKMTRLKRRLPQDILAARAGISLSTLVKIEKGSSGVAIGTVASVLQALDLGTPFSKIGLEETLNQDIEEILPKRVRSSQSLF